MKRRLQTGNKFSRKEDVLPSHMSSRTPSKIRSSSKTRAATMLIAISFVFGVIWFTIADRRRTLPFYLPTPNAHDVDWDWPVVHIVNTRFMQEQGNLTALGKARLALFRVFCLPTMIRQSTQKFLWIIKTDPNLDPDLLREMVEALSPYPNFFLVGSNVNFRVNEYFPGAWRDGAAVEDLKRSNIYTGNQTLLERAMDIQKPTDPYPILETRLDADDGLHFQYLEAIQLLAIEQFNKTKELKWMYWCSRRHVEWHFAEKIFDEKPIWDEIVRYGAVAGIQHTKLCITPGITVGFPVGVSEKDVPVHPHDELIKRIRQASKEQACGLEKVKDCLQFVETFVFEAIRSRSPTSAGMLNIETKPNEVATDGWLYFAFLNMIHEKFGITLNHLEWINGYFKENLVDIAEENLLGQCTTGHSCKESARLKLQELIARRRNESIVHNRDR